MNKEKALLWIGVCGWLYLAKKMPPSPPTSACLAFLRHEKNGHEQWRWDVRISEKEHLYTLYEGSAIFFQKQIHIPSQEETTSHCYQERVPKNEWPLLQRALKEAVKNQQGTHMDDEKKAKEHRLMTRLKTYLAVVKTRGKGSCL